MQLDQTYVPGEASVQVNNPTEQTYYNQVMLQNCSPFPYCPAASDTLLQRESVEQIHQEAEQTMPYLYTKGHLSSVMPLTNRRERNRQRERKRQMRLREGFNVLYGAIPDYFSGREPGDRLSKIQTLRLAKKYIAALHELLETS